MMSRLYYVCCDGCGIPESEGHITPGDARQAAKAYGWKRKRVAGKVRDLCKRCLALKP